MVLASFQLRHVYTLPPSNREMIRVENTSLIDNLESA
jgi:hypothetical protein